MYQAQQVPLEGAAPFAQTDLPEQGSNPQTHQGANQQWNQGRNQQAQAVMGPIGDAYNGVGTQYNNFTPHPNQWGVNTGPNAEMAQSQQNQIPPLAPPNAVVQWAFPPVDAALHAMLELRRSYLEQGEAIGEALATVRAVKNMQLQLQQTGVLQQNQYGMPHNTGSSQQQQPMEQPDVQQLQHNTGVQQQQHQQPQVNNSPIMQPPTPQDSLHNLLSSSVELLYSSSSNNHIPEDDPIWRDYHSHDAIPASNNQVSPPTHSLSATSLMAGGSTPYAPQNSQLLPPAPVAATCATDFSDWDPAAFSQRRQQQTQQSSGRKHHQSTAGSSGACGDNQQFDLSSSESRFDKESVALRVSPVIFLFPGKTDMISLDLCTAMDGFCEKKMTSKKSIRHFVKHILTKIYSSPNASSFVTADCGKSSKGFKIVPEESLRTLAEFWMTHFKSTQMPGAKEVAAQMGQYIRTCIAFHRLALKHGRT